MASPAVVVGGCSDLRAAARQARSRRGSVGGQAGGQGMTGLGVGVAGTAALCRSDSVGRALKPGEQRSSAAPRACTVCVGGRMSNFQNTCMKYMGVVNLTVLRNETQKSIPGFDEGNRTIVGCI